MARVKLDEVVSSLLNEMDSSVHTRRRLYDIGVDVLRKLNMDVHGRIRTEKLPVASNKTLSYPIDYINYLKIGVHNCDGEIATFERNKDLSMYNSDGNRTVNVPTDPSDYSNINEFRNYNLDGVSYQVFGVGSDINLGSVREDDENRCFVFDPSFAYVEIMLEYLSNQIDEDGEFYVDERLEDAVKAGIYYRSIKRLAKTPQYQKDDAKRDWLTEQRKGKARVNPFRLSDANDTIRKTIKPAVKH